MADFSRIAIAAAICALAAAPGAWGAGDEEKSAQRGAHPPNTRKADEPQGKAAPMSRAPAPASGSMPKGGAAPKGKLGTEPTAHGRLGTDPKPDEKSTRPPRPSLAPAQ